VIAGGGTPSTKVPEYFGDDYPWITPKDLSRQSKRYVAEGERGISEAGLAASSAKVLPAGSIVISSRAPIGLTAIAQVPLATNQGCRSFIPGDAADSLFMYYLLGSMSEEFERRANGSTFKEISGSTLASMEIELPSVAEQRGIAAALGALDDKIESNQLIVELIETLGEALFAEADLTTLALSEVASLTMGSSPPGSSYNEEGVGMPFYQGVRDFRRRYPGLRVWTSAPVRVAQPNDTLVSVRAPVGNLNRAYEQCCVGRGVAAVHSEWPSTIYYALRAANDLWKPFQQEGTVFGAINRADLAAAKVSWPKPAQLVQLEVRLVALDNQIRLLISENDRLMRLRNELLPALLSGRIRTVGAQESTV
jgi:type I restriction enzyme S subunit